jgi:rhodanese-related sulfurtransferase
VSYPSIDNDEALRLLERLDVLILDVRTPQEHAQLGHIAGARLLPVQCIASAPAVLPRDGRPILVYCEHGVRSRHAADLLVRVGFDNVHNLAFGMAEWHGPREMGETPLWGPSPWLLEHASLYASKRRVLDVACGRGRHALLFAAAGFEVTAMDRHAESLAELRASAAALGVRVDTREVDLEAPDYSFGAETWDVIVVTRYLHRPLFPALRTALAPDGLLVYETFTTAQRDEPTGPSRPEFLLEPGELRALVAPLEIVAYDEEVVDARHLARVVARKP